MGGAQGHPFSDKGEIRALKREQRGVTEETEFTGFVMEKRERPVLPKAAQRTRGAGGAWRKLDQLWMH